VGYYIGVDGGGTFTDCAAMDEEGRLYYAKAATTKDDFAVGMFPGQDHKRRAPDCANAGGCPLRLRVLSGFSRPR
jgi:N-methylhydantoinase A/oxoprolinase/acetone carboxylase beta subunit